MSALSDLAAELVAIDSVNPDLVAGGAGERQIARFVADWLRDAGLDVQTDEIVPGRFNVVGVAHGSGGGRSLLLNAHMDTVGVAGMEAPFEPRVEDGRLYGRGAYDMKASLAAIMVAGARVAELGVRGDVLVTAVADEEVASIGAEAVARSVHADGAIVAEPTELRVAVAHKGFVWFELETRGHAAHGSRADLGIDAIARMGPVLTRLGELADSLADSDEHPLLGHGSVHGSLIEGGVELSTYPDRCLLKGERRTLPGESRETVETEVARLLGDVDGATRVTFERVPFEADPESRLVAAVRRHAGDAVVGVPFWADSAVFAAAGISTVLLGPAGEGAHAAVEWVDLASAERCAEIYFAVAADFCS